MRIRPFDSDAFDYILIIGVTRFKLLICLTILALVSMLLALSVLRESAVCPRHIRITPEIQDIVNTRVKFSGEVSRPRQGLVHFARTSRRLPQALIVGVRKCGTRALLEMLFLHPDIQKAAGEIHFFDRDENYRRGLEWYRRKMPHSFQGQITIEKSPSYFVTPEVPERVRAMNGSLKLLVIVREPVTRAVSDFTQLRSHAATATSGMTASGIPSSAQPLQRSFEELALLPDGSVNLAYRPLAVSMYHTFLLRWLEVFPRRQILVVNGDLLIKDPVPELRKIETFLGLEHKITRDNFYFNHTKGFYCLRNDTADKCLRETKGRKHPHISSTVVTKLRNFFSDHNRKLYELLGEDLGWPEE